MLTFLYNLLLAFAQSITNMYDLNKFESKTNNFHRRVFCVDDKGNIYDDKTGEVFGNTKEHIDNKFDMDNQEENQAQQKEQVIIMPDKS